MNWASSIPTATSTEAATAAPSKAAAIATSEAASVSSTEAAAEASSVTASRLESASSSVTLLIEASRGLWRCGTGHEESGLSRLLWISVELISCFEAFRLDSFIGLYGEAWLIHRTEHIVNLSDLVLVLKVDASHEEGNVAAEDIADQQTFARVRELSDCLNILRRTLIET